MDRALQGRLTSGRDSREPAAMNVRRTVTCTTCGLTFLIVFDAADRLSDIAVRIDCPRVEQGTPCRGQLYTHLPVRYRVLPASAGGAAEA